MGEIPRLEEWLLWEVFLSRKQLLWMEAFLAESKVRHFYRIKVLKQEAAASLHVKRLCREKFFLQLEDSCRVSDGQSRKHEAPALSDRGKQSRATAVAVGVILQ